jgi:hypothetical protein
MTDSGRINYPEKAIFIMRIADMARLGIFLFTDAYAAGSVAYGSRVGTDVTVVGISGIGTSRAIIRAKHTRENARAFCTEYSNDRSEECVDRTLRETRINDQLDGNCETRWFTSLYGEHLRFVVEAKKRSEFGPKYIILRDGKPLDGSGASVYSYNLEQFEALCPSSRIWH